MEWDTANPRASGADPGAFARAWTAWLEPLALELRQTASGSSERQHAVTRAVEQICGAARGMDYASGARQAGIESVGPWLRSASPMLRSWPQLLPPLQALEDAYTHLEAAARAASAELDQIIALAGTRWQERVIALPASSIDAWSMAEHWSLAMEHAWDERLETASHGSALRKLQQAREEFRQAAASVLDAAAAALGLPGPGAVAELEAAMDRLDRAHDREIEALRAEITKLHEEVHHLRRGTHHRD